MSHHSNNARPPTRRPPLSDTTLHINNSQHSRPLTQEKIPHHESLRPDGQLPARPWVSGQYGQGQHATSSSGQQAAAQNVRLSAISKESHGPDSNRNSQISTTSTNASGGAKVKMSIGPWRLGKTLGHGSTARVRFAKHAKSGQYAAVKIVQKKAAHLTQAGSLASLSRKDAKLPDVSDGFRRMPYGVEREVAIMKLIEHPHVMKLYDIWENRTEIYLVLEYVDDGELFEHISKGGCLSEEEGVKFFRQILSGIDYCHSYNICHRDLKPENILINKAGEVRIADFGMAALQQTADHRLQTSCGSPHYAAPEVVRGGPYRGNKVDIWSLGVILYAMLSGYLPFDSSSMTKLLHAIQRGKYVMPRTLSYEAQSLIDKMLQCNPRDRISIEKIWLHPLMRKYSYLDSFGRGASNIERMRDCGRPVLRRSDIDKDLLRHLHSMWHTMEEAQIVKFLLNDEANDQKLFYGLLLRHRERQLENYSPDVNYSKSDYHHGDRPLEQISKSSTCQFVQPKQKGHSRQVSRFTVVSNVSKKSARSRSGSNAATEGGGETMLSYDPFNVSRTKHVDAVTLANAKVVVHKGRASLQDSMPVPLVRRQSEVGSAKKGSLTAPRGFISRSSLASSTRSRGSSQVRVAMAHKRGISFPHSLRRPANKAATDVKPTLSMRADRHSKFSEVTDDGGDTLRAIHNPPGSSRTSPSKTAAHTAAQAPDVNKHRASHVWQCDVRKLSSSLARDCDNAFYRASHASESASGTARSSGIEARNEETPASSLHDEAIARDFSHLYVDSNSRGKVDDRNYRDRPLPSRPERSESTRIELENKRRSLMTQRITGESALTPRHLERMVEHIDHLLEPSPHRQHDGHGRRTASAPMRTNESNDHRVVLQAINEASFEESPQHERLSEYDQFLARERTRNTSAPEPRRLHHQKQKSPGGALDFSRTGAVASSSPPSPAKAPAPLNIRKRSSQGPAQLRPLSLSSEMTPETVLHKQQSTYSDSTAAKRFTYSEDLSYAPQSSGGTIRKKKSNWFHRNTSEHLDESTLPDNVTNPSQSSSDRTVRPLHDTKVSEPLPKKSLFGLGRLFKRHSSRDAEAMKAFQIQEGDNISITSVDDANRRSRSRQHEGETRQIASQQNWFARLFRVKPARKYLCFTVSKHRAQRELANLLREWKKYGVRDVVVDKERNVIFGRVGAKNYLQLKEVSFACEILTVIEHGRKYPLSIVRFTQEKGAASSFYKVVDTLETVLKARGMLVTDERKQRMMIKTLLSFNSTD